VATSLRPQAPTRRRAAGSTALVRNGRPLNGHVDRPAPVEPEAIADVMPAFMITASDGMIHWAATYRAAMAFKIRTLTVEAP
jgi:hypothetical protein